MLPKLSHFVPQRCVKLEAALKGVAGYTGIGSVRHCAWTDGRATLQADLCGIAGVKADIVARGDVIGAIACRDGVATARLDTRAAETQSRATLVTMIAGDVIEIRQNGVAILRGVLEKI